MVRSVLFVLAVLSACKGDGSKMGDCAAMEKGFTAAMVAEKHDPAETAARAKLLRAQCSEHFWSKKVTDCAVAAETRGTGALCFDKLDKQQTADLEAATAAAASAAAATPPAAAAITPAEAEKFGKAFADALGKCDPAALDAIFDVSEISKKNGLGDDGKVGASMCAGMGGDHSARFTKIVTVDGALRPRVRLRVGTGVNFMEPVLVKTGDAVKAVDAYVYRSGEMMSDTFKSMATWKGDPVGARAYVDAQNLYSAAKYAEARKRYGEVPDNVRATNKTVALLGLSIAFRVDDKTYANAMAEFAKNFPNDTALPMVMIDQYAIAKQYPKLIATEQALLGRLGDDAYIRTMLADARLQSGDKTGALADAQLAFGAEPDMVEARNILLDAAAAAGDFDQAIVSLDASVKFGDDLAAIMKDLHANKADAKFLASPQFKAWSTAHPAK